MSLQMARGEAAPRPAWRRHPHRGAHPRLRPHRRPDRPPGDHPGYAGGRAGEWMPDEFSSKEHDPHRRGHPRRSPLRRGEPAPSARAARPPRPSWPPASRSRARRTSEGMRLRVYVVEVRRSTKGPQVLISAPTRPGQAPVRAGGARNTTTAPWRSSPSPVRRAAAPSWPSSLPESDVDPSAPAWAPGASGSTTSWRSSRARRWMWFQMVRGAGGVHCRGPVPRRCCQCGCPGRGQGLPCGGARRPALPGHRQGGPERPAGGQADGLEVDIKPASAPADEEPEDKEDILLDDEAETEE